MFNIKKVKIIYIIIIKLRKISYKLDNCKAIDNYILGHKIESD